MKNKPILYWAEYDGKNIWKIRELGLTICVRPSTRTTVIGVLKEEVEK